MKCTKCSYQFCWTCHAKFPFHNDSLHQAPKIFRVFKLIFIALVIFLFIMLLISQLSFVKSVIVKIILIGFHLIINLPWGVQWLYFKLWRPFVGFLFLQSAYIYFLDNSASLEENFSAMVYIISTLIITHFWGGYYLMMLIILVEALIGGCIFAVRFIRKKNDKA